MKTTAESVSDVLIATHAAEAFMLESAIQLIFRPYSHEMMLACTMAGYAAQALCPTNIDLDLAAPGLKARLAELLQALNNAIDLSGIDLHPTREGVVH